MGDGEPDRTVAGRLDQSGGDEAGPETLTNWGGLSIRLAMSEPFEGPQS